MYRAPLDEIRFVLHELLGDAALQSLPAFGDYSVEYADAVLDQAAAFAENELAPINADGDGAGARWTPEGVKMGDPFKSAFLQFVEGGWTRLHASPHYEGLGAPQILTTAVEEMWASANLAFQLCPMLSRGAYEAIERCGSADQKRRYLPKLVSGEWTGTMNLTEPQAGSDLAEIRTRAIPEGSHHRIIGQKIFITYGDHDFTSNIIHLVLARIDGAPAGTKGISLFLVPKILLRDDDRLGDVNDLRCVSIERKLGLHASPTCVMVYGDGGGAVGFLVGEPNRGLEYMFVMMNAARLSVGLQGYALAERSFQNALSWARTRIQGRTAAAPRSQPTASRPIAEHPDVKRMLLTIKAYADAARSIALYGAMQLDLAVHAIDTTQRAQAQIRADLLIPIIKAWSTETGEWAASLGIQVHGGMGYVEDTGAAQLLRDVRVTSIYEGTTGIQALDLVGRKIARDGGAAMRGFIAQMLLELRAMAGSTPMMMQSASLAIEAIDTLERCTDSVLALAVADRGAVEAIAVPYLMLCGTVTGGWMMARAQDIALRRTASGGPFYASKVQSCQFYLSHILPAAFALGRTIMHGSASVTEADLSNF